MTERVKNYRGYRLEMTSVGVDVVMPGGGMYIATKVSLRQAMRVIHHHRRLVRAR